MRRLTRILLDIYLFPLRINRRLMLYAKGILIRKEEHFIITSDVIRRKFPEERGVIIDAGAFDGDSTIFFARDFPRNTVIGFEPNSGPFDAALRNCSSFPNIKLENFGLASFSGETVFHVTNDAVSSSLFEVGS